MTSIGGNLGGVAYENKVKHAVRQAERNIKNFYLARGASGGFDNTSADLYLNVNKRKFGVEIKKDPNAQMGGNCQFRFDTATDKFYFVNDAGAADTDVPTIEMIQDALETKRGQIERFIAFIKKFPPTDYHARIKGLPISCTKEAWLAAVDKGLLRDLNTNIPFSVKFIANHYAKKDVHYIQIGRAGLFYMTENPLNLPIPQLQGNINIELRLSSNAGKIVKSFGVHVVTGGIRAQARLKTKNLSPYSLDKPDDVKFLFENR